MPWKLVDPVMKVRCWEDPSGTAWLYPTPRGWAVCDRHGLTKSFKVRHRAVEAAMAPAFRHARERLANFKELQASLANTDAFKARGQAIRWGRHWTEVLTQLRQDLAEALEGS